ncbi:uncharacterized protein LOC144678316 isoform X1 [Cetorhinus maximus]
MNLFSGIFIICALVTEASTLKSFSCKTPTGNCTQQEACDPAQNLNCRTTLATWSLSSDVLVMNGCGNCTGNVSFNGGTLSAATTERCCQSDLCNNQTITEETNTTLNGLECYTCPALLSNTCENPNEMVKCVGVQTRCLHFSVMYQAQDIVINGCASESTCKNSGMLKLYGVQPKQDPYCCKVSGCNLRRSEDSTTTPANTVTGKNDSPAVRSFLALPLVALILSVLSRVLT